jgi:transposase
LRRESKNYDKNSFLRRGNPKLTNEQKEIAALKRQLRDIFRREQNI